VVALERFYEELLERKKRLDGLFLGPGNLCDIMREVRKRAEAEANDDVEFRRVDRALHKALERYAKAHARKRKGDQQPPKITP